MLDNSDTPFLGDSIVCQQSKLFITASYKQKKMCTNYVQTKSNREDSICNYNKLWHQ